MGEDRHSSDLWIPARRTGASLRPRPRPSSCAAELASPTLRLSPMLSLMGMMNLVSLVRRRMVGTDSPTLCRFRTASRDHLGRVVGAANDGLRPSRDGSRPAVLSWAWVASAVRRW